MNGMGRALMRRRAEFWTTRDPSTIGHLYDKSAVAFAGEVLALLDRLEAAEAERDQWKATSLQWVEEYETAWQKGWNAAQEPQNRDLTASGPESGQGDHRDDEGRSGAREEGK